MLRSPRRGRTRTSRSSTTTCLTATGSRSGRAAPAPASRRTRKPNSPSDRDAPVASDCVCTTRPRYSPGHHAVTTRRDRMFWRIPGAGGRGPRRNRAAPRPKPAARATGKDPAHDVPAGPVRRSCSPPGRVPTPCPGEVNRTLNVVRGPPRAGETRTPPARTGDAGQAAERCCSPSVHENDQPDRPARRLSGSICGPLATTSDPAMVERTTTYPRGAAATIEAAARWRPRTIERILPQPATDAGSSHAR